MDFRDKKIIIVGVIVSVMVLFVTVVFAALASNLNISFGEVTQNALTWNVGFKGSSVTPIQEGTSNTGLSCGTATITPSTVTISDSTLSKPGDKCTYDLTIENTGDIAAKLSNISATPPTDVNCNISGSMMICENFTYKLTTISGDLLSTGITINKKEAYNIELTITYTGEELSSVGVTQSNAKFTLIYNQSANRNGTASEGIVEPLKKCKRATILHTETCDRSRLGCNTTGYYSGGSKDSTTVTYGSLGTSGTLTAGDAFDCDVNGDGIYDPETERFYYVSGLDGDSTSNYAVLIYYTNVSEGVANNASKFPYNSDNVNNLGPVSSYEQLPAMKQWKNVSLSNHTRQIYSHIGETNTVAGSICAFTYTDRAARLLTAKEVNKACNITIGSYKSGELDSCEYLMEHSSYSTTNTSVNTVYWWLENPQSKYASTIWGISGTYRGVAELDAKSSNGIRPAIEVLKTDIEY